MWLHFCHFSIKVLFRFRNAKIPDRYRKMAPVELPSRINTYMKNSSIDKAILEAEISQGIGYKELGIKYGYSNAGIRKVAIRLGINVERRIVYNGHNKCKTLPKCVMCQSAVKQHNHKFCSKTCMGKHTRSTSADRILKGEVSQRPTLKKYFIETYGHKCSCCKNTEWNDKPIPLDLDHIDGNSDNNFPSNLRLLCPNCHAQTPTYKGGNIGLVKGTVREIKRRERYHNNKADKVFKDAHGFGKAED